MSADPLDLVRLRRPAPGFAAADRRQLVVFDAGLTGRIDEQSGAEPMLVVLDDGGSALAGQADLEVLERCQLPVFRD